MSVLTDIWIIVSFSICRSVALYFYAINSSTRSHNLVNATIIHCIWWEAVDMKTGCADYHATTKKFLMEQIDDDLKK